MSAIGGVIHSARWCLQPDAWGGTQLLGIVQIGSSLATRNVQRLPSGLECLAKPSSRDIILPMRPLLKPFQWLRQAAGHRFFWLGVPLLLYLPSVTGPFVFDDLLILQRAERFAAGESGSLGLFRFAPSDQAWQDLRDRGTFPWWTPERLRIDFFRPLAEWSFYLDVLLFGRHTTGHRLVSLAWFTAALLCLHRLYAAASGDRVRAGIAAFFFGICQTVTQPATFICNRNDLMVVVGTALAALAYCSAAGPRLRNAILAGAAFAGALLSKEIAIAFAGIVVADAVFFGRRHSQQERGGRRLTAWVIALLAVCYLGWFAATRPWHLGLGEGVELSNISVLSQAPRAIPLYLAVWTTGFPISLLFHAPAAPVIIVGAVGLLVTALLVPSLWRLVRDDRAAVFFMLWAGFFLAIALLTFTETRALCVASVGWTYLLAGLLVPRSADCKTTWARDGVSLSSQAAGVEDAVAAQHVETSREGGHVRCNSFQSEGQENAPAPLWLRHWLLAANGMISLCCAIGSMVMQTRLEHQLRQSAAAYVEMCNPPPGSGDLLVVAEAETGLELLFAPERLEFITGIRDLSVTHLALLAGDKRFTREDDHTLVCDAIAGDLLDRNLYRLSLGREEKRHPGQVFTTRHFTAEIRKTDERQRVTSLAFRFAMPLESARLHFYPPDLAAIARGRR